MKLLDKMAGLFLTRAQLTDQLNTVNEEIQQLCNSVAAETSKDYSRNDNGPKEEQTQPARRGRPRKTSGNEADKAPAGEAPSSTNAAETAAQEPEIEPGSSDPWGFDELVAAPADTLVEAPQPEPEAPRAEQPSEEQTDEELEAEELAATEQRRAFDQEVLKCIAPDASIGAYDICIRMHALGKCGPPSQPIVKASIKSSLSRLCESGVVTRSGEGKATVYQRVRA